MLTRELLISTVIGSALLLGGCKGKDGGDDKTKRNPGTSKPATPNKTSPINKPGAAKPLAVPKPESLPKFPELTLPAGDPQTPAKIALGHQLFFDKRLSVDNSRSCYSCHQNEQGNGGAEPLAIGARNKQLTRRSPTIWNVAYFSKFYWDGRSGSLEAQMKGAWGGGNMGVGAKNLAKKAAEIAKIEGYKAQFARVFPKEGVTPDTIARAVAAYERTLVCNKTRYDQYAGGKQDALTAQEKQGLALFMGKAQCTACHAPPLFSNAMGTPDGVFFNTGIGTAGIAEDKVDVGRFAVTKKQEDWAAFKIPSLRNVAKSAPYFHDGSVNTLAEAVKLMARGGHPNKNKSALMADRKLTETELAAIVAFLGSLDCNTKLDTPKLP